MANDTLKNQIGAFIPTTDIYDVISNIYAEDVNSVEFKELLVRMYQNLNRQATILNMKDTGYYDVQEFVCGQVYFPNPGLSSQSSTAPSYRQVYRKVINFGALPNTATKNVPHEITTTPNTTFTRIYGTATDPVGKNYIPLPYASPTAANNIELKANATNVTVITGTNRSAFTATYIVLEYIQS